MQDWRHAQLIVFSLSGHSGVLVNASGNIDPFQAIVPLARNQGHDNQGEIWMSLITYGSIHETHEWFGNDSRGNEIFYVFGCSIMWAILPIREWRCQDIDQVLLHENIFCFSVFSCSEVLGKITSIRSKLPTAACWSREEKRGNSEANLL